MSDLDDLWDFDDPSASENRFREAAQAAAVEGDADRADEACTQLARALGLQDRFTEGHAVLDALEERSAASSTVRVRALLERGRLLRSGGDSAASVAPFRGAWELASAVGEEALAVDAAHMLAIVDAPPGADAWHERAMALATASADPRARKWRASLWNNVGWGRFEGDDHGGALAAFESALAARREQGTAKETRIAEWCVARALRALGRVEEALAIQQRLASEWAAAGQADVFVGEEIGECLLALGRESEARPYFAHAAESLAADATIAKQEPELLAADATIAAQEPERIHRLRRLAGDPSTSPDA